MQGIELMACTSIFDDFGRFAPTYDETRSQRLAADTVIFAIGQEAELEAARQDHLALEGGRIKVDQPTMSTSLPGVFASGFSWPGRSSPAHPGGGGRGQRPQSRPRPGPLFAHRPPADPGGDCPRPVSRMPEQQSARIPRVPSRPLQERPVGERLQDFDSAELVYPEADALIEARRCLHCGRGAEVIDRKCIRCLTCVRCCPFWSRIWKIMRSFPRRPASPAASAPPSARLTPSISGAWRADPTAARRGNPAARPPGGHLCLFARDYQPGGTRDPGYGVVGLPEAPDPEDLLAPFEMKATGLVLKECRQDCRLEQAGSCCSAWCSVPTSCW